MLSGVLMGNSDVAKGAALLGFGFAAILGVIAVGIAGSLGAIPMDPEVGLSLALIGVMTLITVLFEMIRHSCCPRPGGALHNPYYVVDYDPWRTH
jgi:hypothetical protein